LVAQRADSRAGPLVAYSAHVLVALKAVHLVEWTGSMMAVLLVGQKVAHLVAVKADSRAGPLVAYSVRH